MEGGTSDHNHQAACLCWTVEAYDVILQEKQRNAIQEVFLTRHQWQKLPHVQLCEGCRTVIELLLRQYNIMHALLAYNRPPLGLQLCACLAVLMRKNIWVVTTLLCEICSFMSVQGLW